LPKLIAIIVPLSADGGRFAAAFHSVSAVSITWLTHMSSRWTCELAAVRRQLNGNAADGWAAAAVCMPLWSPRMHTHADARARAHTHTRTHARTRASVHTHTHTHRRSDAARCMQHSLPTPCAACCTPHVTAWIAATPPAARSFCAARQRGMLQ
jgi:hypothetical protein